MGKAAFFNIQGKFNKIQCYLSNKNMNMNEDKYNAILDNIDIGDILGIEGGMFYTKTNEYVVAAFAFQLE